MKKNLIACMVFMTASCFALTPDDIDELVNRALADDDATRAVDAKRPEERLGHLAKRIEQHVAAYCAAHNVVLHALPQELHDEVKRVTTLLAGRLTDTAKPRFVNDCTIKKLVHATLCCVVDHTACYVDKKDIEKHLECKINDLQKKVGVAERDVSPALQGAIRQHKCKVRAALEKRLSRGSRSYTTDKEIEDMTKEASQLLLTQMWAGVLKKAQDITLAYLKKRHCHDSLYVQPPEAKRLQKIANEIKKQITGF